MPDLLYIDIETRPNPDMLRFIPKPKPATREDVRRDLKRPETILRHIHLADEKRQEKYQEALDKMALDVDYCKIVALGMWDDDCTAIDVLIAQTPEEEKKRLRTFWMVMSTHHRPCGYNILGFDLPIILRRSWVLGVKPTKFIDLRRYSTAHTVDLMQVLYNWGASPGPRSRGLKAVAEMYGIENELPELDGSMVEEMDRETLEAYCTNDVRMTRELAVRTRGWYWR